MKKLLVVLTLAVALGAGLLLAADAPAEKSCCPSAKSAEKGTCDKAKQAKAGCTKDASSCPMAKDAKTCPAAKDAPANKAAKS